MAKYTEKEQKFINDAIASGNSNELEKFLREHDGVDSQARLQPKKTEQVSNLEQGELTSIKEAIKNNKPKDLTKILETLAIESRLDELMQQGPGFHEVALESGKLMENIHPLAERSMRREIVSAAGTQGKFGALDVLDLFYKKSNGALNSIYSDNFQFSEGKEHLETLGEHMLRSAAKATNVSAVKKLGEHGVDVGNKDSQALNEITTNNALSYSDKAKFTKKFVAAGVDANQYDQNHILSVVGKGSQSNSTWAKISESEQKLDAALKEEGVDAKALRKAAEREQKPLKKELDQQYAMVDSWLQLPETDLSKGQVAAGLLADAMDNPRVDKRGNYVDSVSAYIEKGADVNAGGGQALRKAAMQLNEKDTTGKKVELSPELKEYYQGFVDTVLTAPVNQGKSDIPGMDEILSSQTLDIKTPIAAKIAEKALGVKPSENPEKAMHEALERGHLEFAQAVWGAYKDVIIPSINENKGVEAGEGESKSTQTILERAVSTGNIKLAETILKDKGVTLTEEERQVSEEAANKAVTIKTTGDGTVVITEKHGLVAAAERGATNVRTMLLNSGAELSGATRRDGSEDQATGEVKSEMAVTANIVSASIISVANPGFKPDVDFFHTLLEKHGAELKDEIASAKILVEEKLAVAAVDDEKKAELEMFVKEMEKAIPAVPYFRDDPEWQNSVRGETEKAVENAFGKENIVDVMVATDALMKCRPKEMSGEELKDMAKQFAQEGVVRSGDSEMIAEAARHAASSVFKKREQVSVAPEIDQAIDQKALVSQIQKAVKVDDNEKKTKFQTDNSISKVVAEVIEAVNANGDIDNKKQGVENVLADIYAELGDKHDVKGAEDRKTVYQNNPDSKTHNIHRTTEWRGAVGDLVTAEKGIKGEKSLENVLSGVSDKLSEMESQVQIGKPSHEPIRSEQLNSGLQSVVADVPKLDLSGVDASSQGGGLERKSVAIPLDVANLASKPEKKERPTGGKRSNPDHEVIGRAEGKALQAYAQAEQQPDGVKKEEAKAPDSPRSSRVSVRNRASMFEALTQEAAAAVVAGDVKRPGNKEAHGKHSEQALAEKSASRGQEQNGIGS